MVTGFGLSSLWSVTDLLCSSQSQNSQSQNRCGHQDLLCRDPFSNSHKTFVVILALDSLDLGKGFTRYWLVDELGAVCIFCFVLLTNWSKKGVLIS